MMSTIGRQGLRGRFLSGGSNIHARVGIVGFGVKPKNLLGRWTNEPEREAVHLFVVRIGVVWNGLERNGMEWIRGERQGKVG